MRLLIRAYYLTNIPQVLTLNRSSKAFSSVPVVQASVESFSLIGSQISPSISFPGCLSVAESKNDAKVTGLSSCVTWQDCTEPPTEEVRRSNCTLMLNYQSQCVSSSIHCPPSCTNCKRLEVWKRMSVFWSFAEAGASVSLITFPSPNLSSNTPLSCFSSSNKCTHRNLLLLLKLHFCTTVTLLAPLNKSKWNICYHNARLYYG